MEGQDGPLRRLTCPHCQATVGLRPETTARRFRCPKCNHVLELATRAKGASPQKPAEEAWVSFPCEVCGTVLSALARQAGQTMECPDCGTHCKVPAAAAQKKKPRLEAPQDLYRFQDEDPAAEAEDPAEFFFMCGTCNSLIYVRDQQVGTTVQCGDCHARLVVPPRPKQPEKWKPREVATVPITVASVAPNEEQIQQSQQLLDEADQKVVETRQKRPKPPKYPFRTGVVTFPFYPLMVGLWVSLAAVLGIVLFLVDIAIEFSKNEDPTALIGLFVSGLISLLAFVLMAFAATHLLNIVERTADGQDKIANGPDTTVFGYALCVVTIFVAEALSVLPGAIIGGLTSLLSGQILPFIEYVKWIPALISRFLLFPIFLMSMLVNDSLANIYSRTVWTSLRDAPNAWRKFYWCSLPVVGVWALAAVGLVMSPNWVLRVPLLAANWILLIYYYRLLGRLAWVLEHQWEKWANPPQSHRNVGPDRQIHDEQSTG